MLIVIHDFNDNSDNRNKKICLVCLQMLTNVSQNLAVTVELVRIYRVATDANAKQDFLANTAR